MKRYCALMLAALLAVASAGRALAEMTPEESDALLVEALFAAAAGTTQAAEKQAAEELTEEELAAHRADLAEYRRLARVWLIAVLAEPMDEQTLSSPEPTATPAPDALPTPTLEEAFEAVSENELGRAYLERLEAKTQDECLEETRLAAGRWLGQIDAQALTEMNEDYACWLYAPGTLIDYPVVQGEDNNYYLHRLFNGENNACGTLFIDYRNLAGFLDPNTLIYGHHMRNGSMFKAITFYAEQTYFDSHPYMLIVTGEKRYLLELFAGYLTSKDDHCYDIAISDAEDLAAFVSEARAKSNFETSVEIEPGDRLVTLSTCAYAFENARYIAIGRLNEIKPVAGASDAPGEAIQP